MGKKNVLTTTKRGDILEGRVVEEHHDNLGIIMYVEVEIKTRERQEIIRVDIPEKDQDLSEMRMSEIMQDIFYELHGKTPRRSKS